MGTEAEEQVVEPSVVGAATLDQGQQIDFATLGMFIIGMLALSLSGACLLYAACGLAYYIRAVGVTALLVVLHRPCSSCPPLSCFQLHAEVYTCDLMLLLTSHRDLYPCSTIIALTLALIDCPSTFQDTPPHLLSMQGHCEAEQRCSVCH